ncbi:poly(U)-specific endoribonuclease homolog [Ostrinia furnacalis]|uniref:poly(U)-specific endoribonuclease homolog n=1 Tax=Ostrinia furnacalis TaxID=93504 RepID=UPI001039E360|nr:poly(U)-specific endoribonuclease homolog [Ostrinia furnacalis]
MCRRGYYIVILLLIQQQNALEYNKQRYNTNTDFLLHEAGTVQGSPTVPKRDYVAPVRNPSTKKEDFPPLGSTTHTQTTVTTARSLPSTLSTRVTQSSGKRDYVAPNNPSLSTTTKKRDDFPSLGTTSFTQTTMRTLTSPIPNRVTQSNNRRDYVAPNFPPLSSSTNAQSGTGKVKDLVNFYDSKSTPQNGPQKVPSYSSILQQGNNPNSGSTAKVLPVTQSTPKMIPTQTPKPLSFSSVVAGSNRPAAVSSSTTNRPSTMGIINTQSKPGNNQASNRPAVLPSTLANNNNQGSSGSKPTDTELQTLTEELLKRDVNNAAKYVTVNYQEKTTSQSTDDKAPLPLLTVAPEAWNIPTIQKFVPLLDNYERDTLVNEHVTPQERNEENAFMDAIMATSVIRHLMNFLKDKGYVSPDPRQQRDFLKQLWFGLYSRGKGKLSSSGFEHSFVSELKNGQVSGLHNWIYFSKEEQANRLNYLGYLKYTQLNDKGAIIKLHFNQQGVDKPVDSLFIGTSPELEMALYTVCFLTRVDDDCNVKLAGKDVKVMTHNFRYRSKNYIGSAYPQI